jgi:hypothetical protein
MPRRVAFAGDWHGNTMWALHCLRELAAAGIDRIYHVGDFGLWPGESGAAFLRKVDAHATRYGITIDVTLGNHDDYDRFAQLRADEDGWLRTKHTPALRFAPRGHTWEDHGVRFASLGGAGSIDRNLRTAGRDWWPDEAIGRDDVRTLAANVTARGWDRVDVLITHEAPAGLTRRGFAVMPRWATPDVQQYCWEQRVRLRHATDLVMPHTLVHGHWHEWHHDELHGVGPGDSGAEYVTDVFSLSADGDVRNLITAELIPYVGVTDPQLPLISSGRAARRTA